MNCYHRQYRSTPRPEAIRGSDYVKCMAAFGVMVITLLIVFFAR